MPADAEIAETTSADPRACPAAGYSTAWVRVRASLYCVRTAGTVATIRIVSAPTVRPPDPATPITVSAEIATMTRPAS
ncbi:hypothetical protein FHS29_000211 [Saccharothrix tamanrassetensis]|uniref:Uncharacterized protein n=1 Tax=Saccharothrix tamanrassetensis TaxID=1051531 RepID=A0A841C934_9PSEU|nr:hypothetical protein [Saccharothrix tamanrassetensis]MBB5953641.1 hypothetical protein [Saccharothrix tamanrassetensis]